ncbi:MAG: hypothetical protein ACE5H0_13650 [Bacteroidota bacterium]
MSEEEFLEEMHQHFERKKRKPMRIIEPDHAPAELVPEAQVRAVGQARREGRREIISRMITHELEKHEKRRAKEEREKKKPKSPLGTAFQSWMEASTRREGGD